MGALVGAHGHASQHMGERCIGSGRQWLLDQFDAGSNGRGEKRLQLLGAPRLVGIGDETSIGPRLSHRRHAGIIAVAAELQFQQFEVGDGAGIGRHLIRRTEAHGVARHGA